MTAPFLPFGCHQWHCDCPSEGAGDLAVKINWTGCRVTLSGWKSINIHMTPLPSIVLRSYPAGEVRQGIEGSAGSYPRELWSHLSLRSA